MATPILCDRCGKIAPYTEMSKCVLGKSMVIESHQAGHVSNDLMLRMDLCSECADKVRGFLEAHRLAGVSP